MKNIFKRIKGRLNKVDYVKDAKKLGVRVGKDVSITGPIFWGSEPFLISIGDNCVLSWWIRFVTHDGGVNIARNLYNDKTLDLIAPIKVGKNCFIGMGTTVLYGTTIGDNVLIGASSVVKGNLESNSVYAGIPAKRICSIEEWYKKNKSQMLHTKLMSEDEKNAFLKKMFLDENGNLK